MKRYIILAAAAISLAACNNDDNYVDEPVAAQISATISQGAVSRASDAKWTTGDSIGITMGDRYHNIKYTAENGEGTFNGSTTMYFRNKQDPETITAYYPFAGTEGTAPAVMEASTAAEFQTADKQPKIDFLYARHENATGTDPNVALEFSHMMGKLTLTFKNGNEGTDLSKITSYTIEGLILDGTFNTATGECSAKTDATSAPLGFSFENGIEVKEVEGAQVAELPSLLLFPQDVDKVTLKIHDSENQDYKCDLIFGDKGIESGNNYQFTIKVNKTGLSVNPSIKDWTLVDHFGDDPDDKLGGDAVSDDSDD